MATPNDIDPTPINKPNLPLRERSFTGGSQRSLGAASPQLVQDMNPPRSSFEHGANRRPSISQLQNRQTSQAPGTSISRPHGSPASFTSVTSYSGNRSVAGQEVPNPFKSRPRVKEGSSGLPLNGGSPEPATMLRQTPSAESPVNLQWRANTSPNINGTAEREKLDPAWNEAVRRDLRVSPVSRRPSQQKDMNCAGDFALEHLFNSFVVQADQIVGQHATSRHIQMDPKIDLVCGPGVNENFDQVLNSLGYIARNKPQTLIDRVLQWRKKYRDSPSRGRSQTDSSRSPAKAQSGESHSASQDVNRPFSPTSFTSLGQSNNSVSMNDPDSILAERRSSIASYIICRAMIEIFAQTSHGAIPFETASLLEDIVYVGQVRRMSKDHLDHEPLKRAKWDVATRLLGIMATFNFEGVVDRFIRDLTFYQKDLGVKGNTNKAAESEAMFFLKSMRHIKLNGQSETEWTKSVRFMKSLTELFVGVHGQALKVAHCRLLESLLLSAVGAQPAIYDTREWRQLTTQIWNRLQTLSGKPKYWLYSFPTQALLLSSTPTDLFLQRYREMIPALAAKLQAKKDTRSPALKAACRVMWSYFSRDRDPSLVVGKPLEEINKAVFFPKSSWGPLSEEMSVAEPLIQLLRIIASKNQEFCFKQTIFPLIHWDFIATYDGKDFKIAQLDPDRMVIGIQAFLAIMADIEQGTKPPFPAHFNDEHIEGHHQRSTSTSSSKDRSTRQRSLSKTGNLARPVATSSLPEPTREYYARFCDAIGKIAIVCDNYFGGQVVLDQTLGSQQPAAKTPLSETRSFRSKDEPNVLAERNAWYDLLHVAIQGLPRCLPGPTPHLPQIFNLLCTGTAHIEKDIAASSAQSLQAIAKQNHAQTVVAKFSSFILQYDNRYSTMSDGGMLGPNHIEDTLTLYVTLLKIWIEELESRKKKTDAGQIQDGGSQQLNNSSIWSQIDRVESQGLFFLCSPSPRVRTFAVDVLRLVTELDRALGQENDRVHSVLMGNHPSVFDPTDDRFSLAERSRLEKALASSNTGTILVELCSSTSDVDISLWLKIFPKLVQATSLVCPMAIVQTREDVLSKITQMQSLIEDVDVQRQVPASASMDSNSSWIASRSVDLNIEQWKLYLMFACTTITKTGSSQQPSMESQHSRKGSKSSQKEAQNQNDSISSASHLFSVVIPLLSAQTAQIRNAVVAGLGAINLNLYKTLLESLESFSRQKTDMFKKTTSTHQRGPSSPRRASSSDFFTTEVAHVYQLTCYLLQKPDILRDEWIIGHVSSYAKELLSLLQGVEDDEAYLRLRVYYCGLVEGLFKAVEMTTEPQMWMTFQTRRAAFVLMETFSKEARDQVTSQPDHRSGRSQAIRRTGPPVPPNAAWANELKSLRMAALNAMATLCAGPFRIFIGNNLVEFNLGRIFTWIDNLVASDGDRLPAIGRRALKNLLVHNSAYPELFTNSIKMLYLASSSKGQASYLEVIGDIFRNGPSPDVPVWRMLAALIFVLGNKESNIRVKAARILRFLDEQHGKNVKLQELDISIADKTFAVNRRAQFEITTRFSKHYPEFAFFVFSEFSAHFTKLSADCKRGMVEAILPWIQTVELVVDPEKNPTADSYMLLINLLDITVSCSIDLPHEIAALWKALCTGPHSGNVQVALDFIIDLSVEWRDGKIIDVARQVVVYMSDTPAGQNVTEYLLQKLTPKDMWQEKRKTVPRPAEADAKFSYVANLSVHLKDSLTKQDRNMSIGQLCLIILVDLIVAPVQVEPDKIPMLLQASLALWDQQPQVFHEPAREMLVHLIHELVISKLSDTESLQQMPEVEKFIDLVRKRDPKVLWAYHDNDHAESPVPPQQLAYVLPEVIKIFSLTYPEIRSDLGKVALSWATRLPVRHLACRSLQIYRCILSPLNLQCVADVLQRLGQTACDSELEVQAYSLELIRTLTSILSNCVDATENFLYPYIFWSICACLGSIHELEFAEGLNLLEVFLEKYDLADPVVLVQLEQAKPTNWWWQEQAFGLTGLIQRGCRSGKRLEKTLVILNQLVNVPSNSVIGDERRLLFCILANLPKFSKAFDDLQPDVVVAAESLAAAAGDQHQSRLSVVLSDFANSRLNGREEFLRRIMSALMAAGNAQFKQESLVFLMGFLTSSCCWYASETLRILELFVAELEINDLESNTAGPELISPLLRLLQTNLCKQALKVLDKLSVISGSSNKEQLQMSMAGTRTSRAVRHEYDHTNSLFGIPEESGWSVPHPAMLKEKTRENLNLLCNIFPLSSTDGINPYPTPDVEFYRDDSIPGSYFPNHNITLTQDEATLHDTSMSAMVPMLDSLDDFFDTPGPMSLDSSPPFSVPNSGAGTPWGLSRQTTADTQLASSSFDKSWDMPYPKMSAPLGYSPDPHAPVQRESPHMSPSAFRTSPKANGSRPGMGARSTTAAAIVQRTPPDRAFHLPPREPEPFSDDDLTSGRASSNERNIDHDSASESRFHGTTMPRRPSFKAGMRSLRKLTGGSLGSSNERLRTTSISSPKPAEEHQPEVPRVPSVYLHNNSTSTNYPKSSDL